MSGLTTIFMRLAAWLMRNRDSDWTRAMAAELEHICASERLYWAFGCLTVAIKRRFTPMHSGTLRISRSVLSLELVVCFLPITIGWYDAVFGDSGVWRLNSTVVENYFLDTPLHTSLLGMMIGGAVIGLVGPIGMFLTLRAVTTGVGLGSRTLGIAMIAGVVTYAAASVALRLVGGPGAYAVTVDFMVLMIVLPIAGIAHLMYLATPANPNVARC